MTLQELWAAKEMVSLAKGVGMLSVEGSLSMYKKQSEKLRKDLDALSDAVCSHDWMMYPSSGGIRIGDCKICKTRRCFALAGEARE